MSPNGREDLLERIRHLQERLSEAEETLRALRDGEVDAIIAAGPDGDRVYTLRGADEAYRIMLQGMAEGALTLTADGLILFSNEQFAAMLRSSLERVIGSRLQDFVAPENADVVSTLLSGTGVRKAEVRLRRRDAAFVPAYLSVQNLVLDGAECRCLIVTDLSEQKRHEEIVAVLEAVPVAVFIAQDAECRGMVGNRMAHELLRMPSTANVSRSALEYEQARSWREVKDGKDIPAEELPMQTAARTGRPVYDYELDILFDDGTYRCWLGNAVPLFDEARRPRGAVGAFVDITDRKRAAEAIEATNAELRNFGNALTQHLREPLDMVVKFTRLLAREFRGTLDEDVDTFISNSLASALRIETLMKALIDYWAVTERGGGSLSPVDCNQVLSQTLLDLQTEIRQSGATVTSDPLPIVMAEDNMLRQVFETLVGNSIKYRDEAVLRIHVSAVRTFNRWLFSVRDNGIGIDPKYAEWVFGMFNRLHGDEIPGTGIGLALCKKIVERYGGRIWVESKPGRGAAFRFTIPTYLDPASLRSSAPSLAPESV
jgi:signal transduction histidine kinase